MNHIKRIAAGLAVAASVFAVAAGSASAQSVSFGFATDPDVGIEGQPGSLKHVAYLATPVELIGKDCDVTVNTVNDSVRDGTSIEVSSNGVSFVAHEVEKVKGPGEYEGHLVLGKNLNGWVRFGPEGVASIDANIVIDCPDTPPATVPPNAPVVEVPVPPAAPVLAPPVFTG